MRLCASMPSPAYLYLSNSQKGAIIVTINRQYISLKGHGISMPGKGEGYVQEVRMLEKEEHLFERLARERNITVEEMRAIISARIE